MVCLRSRWRWGRPCREAFHARPRLPGDDHYLSAEPEQFAVMVRNIRAIETRSANPSFGYQAQRKRRAASPAEHRLSRVHSDGARLITMDMLIMKRPGTGISPAELPQLVGRTATVDIQPDTVLNWDMVD